MPELPEVQTTVNGLKRLIGLRITDIWSDYNSLFYKGKANINDPAHFRIFKKGVIGAKILGVERKAKNIFIHLSSGFSIFAHMKMTGHFMHGEYEKIGLGWRAKRGKKSAGIEETRKNVVSEEEIIKNGSGLHDPYNRFVRLVFSLSDGAHLVLSDMRRFAKVALVKTADINSLPEISVLGPEPLDSSFTLSKFKEVLSQKPNGKIKTVLMDQTVISGIGNIYSDEILWRAGVHPESLVRAIPPARLSPIFSATRTLLKKGIDFGGDSMSDYRNIDGEKGKFQEEHQAYRKAGKPCTKKGCHGTIIRKIVGGRSAHFCDTHQKL
ncbi:MAG: bifunctional DNA-formamidopyrimidine glycosylase/DNA-(apurinic or apyrimidinic site) lyase [Candidatus Taylorbacteria bacterium]|nr:bifunctional DNA-formamidopyrimidine glycosylase/DNA-(apurinic or apyrimidinic site) lyase [Candidatus Taylorbacteria bacterium]